jgi:hypothetical protein
MGKRIRQPVGWIVFNVAAVAWCVAAGTPVWIALLNAFSAGCWTCVLLFEVLVPDQIDTSSSASRQHYIDTGKYLRKGESL